MSALVTYLILIPICFAVSAFMFADEEKGLTWGNIIGAGAISVIPGINVIMMVIFTIGAVCLVCEKFWNEPVFNKDKINLRKTK